MLRTMRALVTLVVRPTVLSFLIAIAISGSALAQSTLAGGGSFSLVVKSDGTVWAFGFNNDGQIGDNTTTTRTWPIQISGLRMDRPSVVPGIIGQLNTMANFANYFLFRKAQTLIWSEYMQHIVDSVNGIRTSPTFLKDGIWDDSVFNRSYIMTHVCGRPASVIGSCQ